MSSVRGEKAQVKCTALSFNPATRGPQGQAAHSVTFRLTPPPAIMTIIQKHVVC